LAVGLSAQDAEKELSLYGDLVSIGAVNSPADVTLSGDVATLKSISASLEERQVFCRFLQVEVAYHSVQMEPLREELLQPRTPLRPRPAKKGPAVVASLRRPEPDRAMMLASLGKLFTLGYPVDWERQFPEGGQLVHLPAYPWQRERHWHESEETR